MLELCKKVHSVPKTWKLDISDSLRVAPNGLTLVVRYLGNGHSWALSHGSGAKEVSAGGH